MSMSHTENWNLVLSGFKFQSAWCNSGLRVPHGTVPQGNRSQSWVGVAWPPCTAVSGGSQLPGLVLTCALQGDALSKGTGAQGRPAHSGVEAEHPSPPSFPTCPWTGLQGKERRPGHPQVPARGAPGAAGTGVLLETGREAVCFLAVHSLVSRLRAPGSTAALLLLSPHSFGGTHSPPPG